MAVALQIVAGNMVRMPPRTTTSAVEIQLYGRALAVLRQRVRLSQAAAAGKIGVTPQAWQRWEAGERQAILRSDLQDRTTAALGFTREDLQAEVRLLRGEDDVDRPSVVTPFRRPALAQPGPLDALPVRDTVQAGAWLAAEDDFRQADPPTQVVARDSRFPHAQQWLSEVRGDSVNLLSIVDGDLVHCVDAIDIGYAPRTGDIVEVQRCRFGGRERELTLKQVEVTPAGLLLWPRSSNPRFQEPLALTEGAEGEEIEVAIRALVVASVRRF